jgi:glyoxylate reductase
MSQPRIIVAGRIPDASLDVLRPHGNVWGWKHDEPIEINELYERIATADAVLTLLTTKVDRAFLDAAGPQLKVVSNVAVGYNNIDVAECRGRGVIATNTPGVLTDATADIAMALILMVTRRLGEGERIVRSNRRWQWGMFMLLGTSLQGRRLGIIGMGAIGQALAKRAKAFGMTVAYSNRTAVSADIEAELGADRLSLDELLATSDIVTINCPYSAETHHLIGPDQFELMRSSAYLINTARGPIVDEAALVRALRSGAIAGAGLDVYEHEPMLEPGLNELDNAVLIPHLGSATVETRAAMATLAARNTVAVLGGQPALTPIT